MKKRILFRVIGLLLICCMIVSLLPADFGVARRSVYAATASEFMTRPMVSLAPNDSIALRSDGIVWQSGGAFDFIHPNYINNIIAVSAGGLYNALGSNFMALRYDGTVWVWHHNQPTQIQGVYDAIAIEAMPFSGGKLLRSNGTVYEIRYDWEAGYQLIPIRGLYNIAAISAGGATIGGSGGDGHFLALCNNGTVWTWSAARRGWSTPTRVSGLSNVVAISAGHRYSIALTNDGIVWAWGRNTHGQLGNGTTTNSNIPVQVHNLDNVAAISAGVGSSLALKNDGTVWIWGGRGRTPHQLQCLENIVAITATRQRGLGSAIDGNGYVWEIAVTSNRPSFRRAGPSGIGYLNLGIYRPSTSTPTPTTPQPIAPTPSPPNEANLRPAAYYRWTSNSSGTPIRHGFYQEYPIIFSAPIDTRIFVDYYVVNSHENRWYLASYVPGLGHGIFWIYSGNLVNYGPDTSRISFDYAIGAVGNEVRIRAIIEPYPRELIFDNDAIESLINNITWEASDDAAITFLSHYRRRSLVRSRFYVDKYLSLHQEGVFFVTAALPCGASAQAPVGVLRAGTQHDSSRHMQFWYQSTNVPFRFDGGTQSEQAAMRRGMESWNVLAREGLTRVRFHEDNGSDNSVLVANACDMAVARLVLGTYEAQQWDSDSVGPHITQFQIRMFRNRIDALTQIPWWHHVIDVTIPFTPPRATPNRYNIFQSVFAHELGHAIGLGHPSCSNHVRDSIMHYAASAHGAYGPTAFDIESVNMLWPPLQILPPGPVVPALGYIQSTSMIKRQVSASYPFYENISQLTGYATEIVHVEILDERIERLNTWLEEPPHGVDPYDIFTIYRLRVIESFQGDVAPGDIIEVRQIGGQQDNEWLINTSEAPIAVGDEAIMFLRASLIEGYPHLLLNPYQTVFHSTAHGAWEGAHQSNEFAFTIAELENVIEAISQQSENERDRQPPTPTPSPSPGLTVTPVPTIVPPPSTPQPTQPPGAGTNLPALQTIRFTIGNRVYSINGIQHISDAAPIIVSNRTLVPLRVAGEALGAQFEWDSARRVAIIRTVAGQMIELPIGIPLPGGMGTPIIVGNRTMVPLRYIAETFGAQVEWDSTNRVAYIFQHGQEAFQWPTPQPTVAPQNTSQPVVTPQPTAPPATGSTRPAGQGTAQSPFLISQPEHLTWVSENHRQSGYDYFRLTADIIAPANLMIGRVPGSIDGRFTGNFDGNGHTITVDINVSTEAGLFRSVHHNGVIQNLIVDGNVSTTGSGSHSSAGGIAVSNAGLIVNSISHANVTGADIVGGLVGSNAYGTIQGSMATGKVIGRRTVGGLVGTNPFRGEGRSQIIDSVATGDVTGSFYVGGLVGVNGAGSVITNSTASGRVTARRNYGDIVGRQN